MNLAPDFGIVGYSGRWQYRPGETVELHLSADQPCDARIRLYRFRQMLPAAGGLSLNAEPIELDLPTARVEPRATAIGSRFEAGLDGALAGADFTLALLFQPTALSAAGNGLVGMEAGDVLCRVVLDGDGRPELRVRFASEEMRAAPVPVRLRPGRWHRLVLTLDGGRLRLIIAGDGGARQTELSLPGVPVGRWRSLTLAGAGPDFPGHSFDGRIEAPILWDGARAPEAALADLERHADGLSPTETAAAAWDFSRSIGSPRVEDVATGRCPGTLVNLPTAAVRGSRWSGSEQCWRHAARDYAAVHFHRDDLADAGWPVSARFRLPDDLPGGVYLIHVSGDAGCDTLPVLVRPHRPGADAAFLASTFTWLAYANDHCLLHGANPEMFANRLLVLTPGDVKLAARPEFGLSLYDMHADGSGVSYASRRRPCLTLRHVQHAWQGGLGSGLWNFSADLLILSWLEREDFAVDLVTDDDLDREGAAALQPYRCLITGSHPEYHTGRSLDAITSFVGTGGRLLYLGGNGFYWRVSTHPDYPETIELRRAEDGNRSWASEPGEYYHAFDGTYGGLWRRNGRPPQALVGVGYSGQGFFRSHPYRIQPGACDERARFLFGAAPEPGAAFGGFGMTGGGAAGIEIDRADAALGTPAHALVLARADRLDDTYILANEEVLVNRPTVTGDMTPLLRADLVFFETPAGGAVLSTGSVAWAGALADPRAGNEVADLTRRAITRFLDPAPFAMPPCEPQETAPARAPDADRSGEDHHAQ